MANRIPAYNNQEEKRKFFSLKIIDTETDLYDFMYKLPIEYREKKGIWRGLPESKFKLYNSLQRENIINQELKSIQDVINRIIDSVNKLEKWNRGVILKHFDKNYDIPNIPIYAALSILQHHGCKTPMLDWTRNPNVALYFAINSEGNLNKNGISSFKSKALSVLCNKKENIRDYFSIYFITNGHPYYNFTSKCGYFKFLENDTENSYIKRKVNTIIEHGGDDYLQQKAIDNAKTELIQKEINKNASITLNIEKFPIQLIEDSPEEKVTHFLNVNYNINAQNGMFILNVDPYKPLEEAIFNRITELSNNSHNIKIQPERAREINLENFICYDIHKKFIPKIIEALNSKGINITKKTMFPDFSKLNDEITFEKIAEKIRS